MFRFNDQNAHLDTRRIFLELTFWATDENDAALTPDQNIGATNVAGHCLIDTASISIGMYVYLFYYTRHVWNSLTFTTLFL